ncbi:LacI family transcriptional regulator [Luteibacter sp. 621]|uniref:LacI family DNA-binding transcriptional regulator n=1 Tax=Luteibacter sp. 621 TaxID=3373916 RepID=UPI003D24E8E0
MPKLKTRIIDLAAAARVSPATVDRVLNGRGGVSERAQSRVLEAAKRLKLNRVIETPPARWLNVPILMQSPTIHFYKELARRFGDHEMAMRQLKVRSAVHTFESILPAEIAEQIERLAAGADALVLTTHDHPLVRAAVRRVSARCPVITLASDIPASGRLAYVGTDTEAAGRLAGELMGRFLGPQGGPILIIKGYHHFRSHEQRERGFLQVLREHFPNVRIIARGDSREDPTSTADITRDVLHAVPGLRGIYNTSVGDEGVADVLVAETKPDDVIFIGHDLTDSNRRLLELGHMDAVLDQNLAGQAARALQHVLARFGRAAAPSPILQPTSIIMRENLPEVI